MAITPAVRRAIIAIFFALIAVIDLIGWHAPAIGLSYDDAAYLVTAESMVIGHGYAIESLPDAVPQTRFPPLFPAILALFMLVSHNTLWLKLLPLACAVVWLVLTRKLLLKMGASRNGAHFLVGLTAASPFVVFLATNLLPDLLFALLVTAALLALLEERATAAGLLAGFATLTRTAGVPLIVACLLTLVIRRRFRNATLFAAAAMIIVGPWFGWALAHSASDPFYGPGHYASANILTALAASEKARVVGRNFSLLLGSPFTLLAGFSHLFAVLSTIFLLGWSLVVRRQLVPDLFALLYCLMLLCWVGPPLRLMSSILPLVLWIVWRVWSRIGKPEAVAAAALLIAVLPLYADAARMPVALAHGYFPAGPRPSADWREIQKLFAFIRAQTPKDAIILANLDPLFYLNTRRKAVRGFAPNDYKLYYESGGTITPDQLAAAIARYRVTYVALTPDRDFAETAFFHRAADALERGGVLEPLAIPGISGDYRLLRVK
jgi:hypothetical protein